MLLLLLLLLLLLMLLMCCLRVRHKNAIKVFTTYFALQPSSHSICTLHTLPTHLGRFLPALKLLMLLLCCCAAIAAANSAASGE